MNAYEIDSSPNSEMKCGVSRPSVVERCGRALKNGAVKCRRYSRSAEEYPISSSDFWDELGLYAEELFIRYGSALQSILYKSMYPVKSGKVLLTSRQGVNQWREFIRDNAPLDSRYDIISLGETVIREWVIKDPELEEFYSTTLVLPNLRGMSYKPKTLLSHANFENTLMLAEEAEDGKIYYAGSLKLDKIVRSFPSMKKVFKTVRSDVVEYRKLAKDDDFRVL